MSETPSTSDSYKTEIHNITSFPFSQVFEKMSTIDSKDNAYISNFFMTFDIETTSINTVDYHDSFMYIWQACINHEVVMGRTWTELNVLLKEIKRHIGFRTLVVYCHNLSFEFQFLRSLFEVNSVFATEPRKILRATIEDNFEFRCSWRLTNMGLDRFLKQSRTVPEEYKKGQNFDYSKLRTPRTSLTAEELRYCRNDVLGLYIALEELLAENNDTIVSVPMTSTGYVRREARERMLSKLHNKTVIDAITMTANQYNLCKAAGRGGNCHCNPLHSNVVIENMRSKDMSSAYPGVMMQERYPMTKFLLTDDPIDNLNPNKAYLMEVELYDCRLSTYDTIPYIAFAKCMHTLNARKDNGRIVSADYIHLAITDIDYRIIASQYTFDVEVITMYSADYDYLPDDYRRYIFDRYIAKCELKFGDPYYYNKEKNKINALFGMMLTDIVHPTIIYTGDEKAPYVTELPNVHEALAKVAESRNNFLAYQWGIWVTAHCRNRLQKAIDKCKENNITPVYCDTDSLKCMVEPEQVPIFNKIFDDLNKDILAATKKSGFDTTYETHNTIFNLGLWEDDGVYKRFKSLGAKKYYIEYVDGRHEITVAGLSKSKGKEYLDSIGGIDAFKPGTIIPINSSGRTTAYYKDVEGLRTVEVYDPEVGENVIIVTGSGVAIENVTYKFTLSDDYREFLTDIGTLTEKPLY